MFDPYQQWLNIPVERQPPTHYELLGLPPHESDAARIHKAVMERMAAVRRYQLGEHAETVSRLLAELSSAFNCLSDSKRREEYDELLRTTAPTIRLPTAERSTRSMAAVQPSLVNKTLPPNDQGRPRRSRGAWLACGAAVATLVCLAVWFGGATSPPASQQTSIATGRLPGTKTALEDRVDSEPIAGIGPASAPVDALPPVPTPRPTRESHLKYFGYSTAGPPKVIEKISPYTNVVLVRDWVDRGNDVIPAADEAGMPIVLCLMGKEMTRAAAPLDRVLSRRSSVIAVCWMRPYAFDFKPVDVVNVGKRLKREHPGVQYWLGLNDIPKSSTENDPLPEGVNVLLLTESADETPEKVRAKGEQVLPGWLERAQGRPIVWCWSPTTRNPRGLVPITEPGTYRACLSLARRYLLAGLIFERYGDPRGQERVPINARSHLTDEIRAIAGELGLDRDPATAASGVP